MTSGSASTTSAPRSTSPPPTARSTSTPPRSRWTRRAARPTRGGAAGPAGGGSRRTELIGWRPSPPRRNKPVEFAHSLKPGRYLADFSLVRVGIAESVPPPRLVIGFGKDRRTLEAVRVQDETVVYRYWLTVAEGDKKVSVALAPGQDRSEHVVKPAQVAANVSGDQRYR